MEGDALAIQDIQRQLRRRRLHRLRARIAEILRHINTPLADIIREHALHYLPAASVLRFRSVSASWSQHISSPIFALTQAHFHRSISGIFSSAADRPSFTPFDQVGHALPDPSLSFLPFSNIIVRSSSNGLLCCFAPFDGPSYFVCNPATAAWAEIPPPPLHPGSDPALALIFEPSACNLDSHYAIVIALSDRRGVHGGGRHRRLRRVGRRGRLLADDDADGGPCCTEPRGASGPGEGKEINRGRSEGKEINRGRSKGTIGAAGKGSGGSGARASAGAEGVARSRCRGGRAEPAGWCGVWVPSGSIGSGAPGGGGPEGLRGAGGSARCRHRVAGPGGGTRWWLGFDVNEREGRARERRPSGSWGRWPAASAAPP